MHPSGGIRMMLNTLISYLTQELGHTALINQPIRFKDREALGVEVDWNGSWTLELVMVR